MSAKIYIDRPPRIRHERIEAMKEIPSPPDLPESNYQMLFQMARPLLMLIAYIVVAISGEGTGFNMLLIPMGLSTIAMAAYSFWQLHTQRRERNKLQREYEKRLADLREEIRLDHQHQKRSLTHDNPSVEGCLHIIDDAYKHHLVANNQDGDLATRLWERRPRDEDFAHLCIGYGEAASLVQYETARLEDFGNQLVNEAKKLADSSRFIEDLPITIPLNPTLEARESGGVAQHALGLVGANKQTLRAYARGMLLQFITMHAPTDAQLFVAGSVSSRPDWRWVYPLPHCAGEHHTCFDDRLDPIEPEQTKMVRFLKNIHQILDERSLRLQDSNQNVTEVISPFMLVVIDLLDVLDAPPEAAESALKDIETNSAMAYLLSRGSQLGASVIVLVPKRRHIPSGCQGMIELHTLEESQTLQFRYAEAGVNGQRYIGRCSTIEQPKVLAAARQLEPLTVRKSYGVDLPSGLDFLDMLQADNLTTLRKIIVQNWADSKEAKTADWLELPIGMRLGGEIRSLKLAAQADGVHGLIAGSTGSGKSELLMTIILSLAVRYDPSIVNFVLVDFKGGGAFEPFKTLPHCVDLVTNLEGSAVERMFAAINAELRRRQKLNTESGSKHIIHYRNQGFHQVPHGQMIETEEHHFQASPYPHLFIIIDEFAEMIAESPEYKKQLESITRVGRSLGVTLILAAQRPSGVSDQMRANIKFRICLRVETREESSEVLGQGDAAYLPTGVPGRGYLQIGYDSLEMVQIAYTGADYSDEQAGRKEAIIWPNRPDNDEEVEQKPKTVKLYAGIIDLLGTLADEYSAPQQKPWPDPLPQIFSLTSPLHIGKLDAEEKEYLLAEQTEGEETAMLNHVIDRWIKQRTTWAATNWDEALKAPIGLIDHPAEAQQQLLLADLQQGHSLIMSSPGTGKTTLARTLLFSLAAVHSPADMQAYILDFGGLQFMGIKDLPHVGDVITADEPERVDRFLRWLLAKYNHRKRLINDAQRKVKATTVYEYNRQIASDHEPAILVIIDNFAAFKESYDSLLPLLIQLLREARPYGLHFVITADQMGSVPGKILSLLTERFILNLTNSSDYSELVGRGAKVLDEIPGRGVTKSEQTALNFQAALVATLPHKKADESLLEQAAEDDLDEQSLARADEANLISKIIEHMLQASQMAKIDLPEQMGILPDFVALNDLQQPETNMNKDITAIIGRDYLHLNPFVLNLTNMPHMGVIGPPGSGKTTTLRTLCLSLAEKYPAEQLGLVLVDFQKRFINYGGQSSLADLPQVHTTITNPEQLLQIEAHLIETCQQLEENSDYSLVLIIDNYDNFADELNASEYRKLPKQLGKLARDYGMEGFHVVISQGEGSSSDELQKQVRLSGTGIGLQTEQAVQRLNGRVRQKAEEPPAGRGYYVRQGNSQLLQVAFPGQSDANPAEELDQWVTQIQAKHPNYTVVWDSSVKEEEPVEELAEETATSEQQPVNSRETFVQQLLRYDDEFDEDDLFFFQLLRSELQEQDFPAEFLERLDPATLFLLAFDHKSPTAYAAAGVTI